MSKSIGQLAFEVFHDSIGQPCNWETLPPANQIAWNETATVVRYAHHLVDRPTIRVEMHVDQEDIDKTEKKNEAGGNIVEETVDGGGIGVSSTTGVEKGGTG
jgi:hypothetical protein